MISAVAFCPQAPVLVPDVARGAAAELDDVRAACRTAIRRLAVPGRRLVVLGGDDRDARYGATSRGSFAGFGLPLEVPLGSDAPGPTELPPSLAVGAWLLRDALGPDCGAVGVGVTDPFDIDEHRWDERWGDELFGDDVGVLVMGDGSARRSLKAPGYLDERAEPYDAAVLTALRSGDPDALVALDPALGAGVLASGAPSWRRVGELLGGTRWRAEVLHEAAPYGVEYVIASWAARG